MRPASPYQVPAALPRAPAPAVVWGTITTIPAMPIWDTGAAPVTVSQVGLPPPAAGMQATLGTVATDPGTPFHQLLRSGQRKNDPEDEALECEAVEI